MKLQHIVESQQFSLPFLSELFQASDQMEKVVARGGTQDYNNKIMACLFYEPSTRTRLSFETAMLRLGGKVISTEQAKEFSSAARGESLEDTVRVLNHFVDVIVLRHDEVGGAKRAAAVSHIPIVNAGDGKGGQHPTQALLDLYTIYREIKTIDGLSVAIVGDLAQGRTARSLTYLLSKYERVKLYFVAPDELQMQPDILQHLDEHSVWYRKGSDLRAVLPEVDVIYQTRIERERLGNRAKRYDEVMESLFIDRTALGRMKQRAIILHPLPRLREISPEVDADSRAGYFRQAQYGIYVRMALLSMLLG
ncbi:MAG TPA: aspartate carbamoyltransferase [Rhodothermia bacterium]|nr:aspartate carbamoyltransferase [Rhodothermia bacterium]